MAKKDFDLAAAISGMVSDLDTAAPEVRMIPLADIIPNPANFYAIDMEALQPLMDSIAMDGLHHYPLVTRHPKQDGKWQLVDGERRYTACTELVKGGDDRFLRIPCTVKEYGSVALAELQLILSNSTNRVLSPAEISKQAEKTEQLFYRLKEDGYEFPGRMRDLVAKACNVSATKLARLKVIRENLHTDFQYHFEKNKLPEQTAYALSRFPAEFQERILKIMNGNVPTGNAVEKILQKYEEGCQWDAANLTCPDGKSCNGGDRFLRHDLNAQSWERKCYGETCCLNCDYAKPGAYLGCDRMCSKAKARIEEHKADEKEKTLRAAEKREMPYKMETQKHATRLLKAIDAAGLADNVRIDWHAYTDNCTVGQLREFAKGNFDDSGSWYQPRFSPDRLANAHKVALQVGCSADYLIGLTDDLNGSGCCSVSWCSPAAPPVAYREVVAKFEVAGSIVKKIVMWDGDSWCFLSGAVIDAECLGWLPLPEED